MPTTQKYITGTAITPLSTGLDSLANNSLAISNSYNNYQAGGGGDGYTLCDVELVVVFTTAPTASTGVSVWFLGSVDDTNFEDGGASLTPARMPDVVLPVRAVTGTQRIVRRAYLPDGLVKFLLKNDGTGQAFSTGNTLKIRPVTLQAV